MDSQRLRNRLELGGGSGAKGIDGLVPTAKQHPLRDCAAGSVVWRRCVQSATGTKQPWRILGTDEIEVSLLCDMRRQSVGEPEDGFKKDVGGEQRALANENVDALRSDPNQRAVRISSWSEGQSGEE